MTDMVKDEVVEKMARAICAQSCRLRDTRGEVCIDPETMRNAPCKATSAQLHLSYLMGEARACIAAANEAGFVLVPKEATEAMVEAVRAPYARNNRGDEPYSGEVQEYWAAMLAASQQGDG